MLFAPHSHQNSWTRCTSVGAANFGTAVISGAANTAGTWTQINAGLTYATDYIVVMIANNFTAATTVNAYIDIGIGADSGAVMTIVEKLCGSHAAAGLGRCYFIPIRIPPDTPIWARHQNTVTTRTAYVQMNTFGGNMNSASFPACTNVVCLGATTATTVGTTITPGATSAEGAWTQIVASTTQDYMGLMIGGLFNVDTTLTANVITTMDAGIGASGQETTLGENLTVSMPAGQVATASDERVISTSYPTMVGIPEGSRLCVRASGSGTADSANSVVLYGLVQ